MNFNSPQATDRKDYLREYYLKHRDRKLEERRERYQRKREHELKQAAEYYKHHPEVSRKANKKWRDKNRAYETERMRQYRKKHPGRIVAMAQKRWALKKASAINLQQIQWWMDSVRSKKSAVCYWCEKRIPSSDIHFDHIIPLSKGGPHTIENLCVSCVHCNESKGPKDFKAWIKVGQQMLSL